MIFASLVQAASTSPPLGQQLLTYVITGLATAGIYAIAASGLVVTYTTSGVFNFAHGAVAMMGAFTFWQFSATTQDGGWGWPRLLSAILVVLVVSPLFGAFVERVIMRGLRGAAEVVRIVVTIGLMLALLSIAPVIWPPDRGRNVVRFFGDAKFELAGVGISYHRVVVVVVALTVAAALRILLYNTKLGTAMRAVVDDPDLARLNGIRPDSVSMASWALGASLAGLSGVLLASSAPLNATTLTLLVVSAFSAAVFGRLTSVPRAFIGALVLGVTQALVVGFIVPSQQSALGRAIQRFEDTGWTLANLQSAVPAIILFIVIWFTKDNRSRSHGITMAREQFAVPRWRPSIIGAVALIVGTAMLGSLMSTPDLISLSNGYLLALVVLALVPLTGYAGQICLAQMTFFGIGAVVMSHAGVDSKPLGLVLAVVAAAATGVAVALPALRLKGIYLALLTAAFAVTAQELFFKQQKVMRDQSVQVPSLTASVATAYGRLVQMGVAFALLGLMIVALRRSSLGRRLVAMKDTPDACRTLGMNLVGVKLTAFAISAAIAGLAGAIAGSTYQADNFALENSLAVTMLGVVGGIASIAGAFMGGFLLGAFQGMLANLFKFNRFGWFSVWSVPVVDLLKIGPGLLGMQLGRNPAGAAAAAKEGLEPLAGRKETVTIVTVGAVVLWLAARFDVISNWSFVAAMVMWLFVLGPIIPWAFSTGWRERNIVAIGVGALLVLVGAMVDWEALTASNGWRVIWIGLLAGAGARALGLLSGMTETLHPRGAPADEIGLDGPLPRSELLDIDRALGLAGTPEAVQ